MSPFEQDDLPKSDAYSVAEYWDAGDMGCGELVIRLRGKMKALRPGEIFHLRATDPGAPEDLPAWCRMTGHALRRAGHPDYFIERVS